MTRAKFSNSLDSFLATRIRGAARMRSWMRQQWPVHLVRSKIDFDLTLDLDPGSYIDNLCIQSGFYEREIVTALQSRCRPGDILWDIGANIGLISLALKRTNPKTKIIAFECSPLTAFRLTQNVAQNDLDIEIANIALSNKDGVSDFNVQNSGNHGLSSLVQPSEPLQSKIRLATLTAMTLIDSGALPLPNLIKIDVEGHESEVFAGFGRHLANKELHTIVFEANDNTASDNLTQLLESFNFTCSPIEPVATAASTNFVAVR